MISAYSINARPGFCTSATPAQYGQFCANPLVKAGYRIRLARLAALVGFICFWVPSTSRAAADQPSRSWGAGLDICAIAVRELELRDEQIAFTGTDHNKVVVDRRVENIVARDNLAMLWLGVYIRHGRLRLGWIPPTPRRQFSVVPDTLVYAAFSGATRASELARNALRWRQVNLGYLEVRGVRISSLSGSTSVSAHAFLKLDLYSVTGTYATFRYPYGSEWPPNEVPVFFPPLAMATNVHRVSKHLVMLTAGPKLAIDLSNLSLLRSTPLVLVKGVDFLLAVEVPLSSSGFSMQSTFRPTATLTLEYP